MKNLNFTLPQYNEDESDTYSISDKVVKFDVNGRCGVMDKHTGRVIIPAMYHQVWMRTDNLIECSLDWYGSERFLYDIMGNKIE